MKFKLALLAGLAIAGTNAFACYTVYDANNRVIYHGEQAPVDMSRPLHETLGRSNPGAQMVFDQGSTCPARATDTAPVARAQAPVNTAAMGAGPAGGPSAAAPRAQLASNGPLLTDRRTAQNLNLPHTVVAGEIVMVPPQYAARVNRPAVNVIPATAFVGTSTADTVNTSAMGAPAARSNIVITEQRNGTVSSVSRY
jgi:hypothetical protein